MKTKGTKSTKSTKKTFKQVLSEAHQEGVKNANDLANDGDMDGNPAVKAQFKDIASDHGYPMPPKLGYAAGGYVMGVIAALAKAITGKDDVLIAYPLLTATISVIPIFGPMIAGMSNNPQGLKFFLYFFADMFALFLLPVYPFYSIFKFIDIYVITKRIKEGKKVREWEWFWN